MRKPTRILGAVAIAGLVAAGGSAYTAANTVGSSVAGYGTNTVTGATTSSIRHTLSADGTQIVSSEITFTEAQTGRTVSAGFGSGALQDCVVLLAVATCSYDPTYTTASATAFNVAVS